MLHVLLLQVQQEQQGTDALVAVGEGMILYDEIEQVCSLLLAGAVERLAEHGLLNAAEYGRQGIAARRTEKVRCLVTSHQVSLEFRTSSHGAVVIEYPRGWPCSRRRFKPVLVVLQQQTPGISVAGNEFQHCLSGRIYERLILKSAREQVEALPGFPKTTFGEPALIQGEAVRQVIAQDGGGSLTETHTLF